MKTTTCQWTPTTGWAWPNHAVSPQLVLYFGATACLQGGAPAVRELVARFPGAVVCGCSTAGEILGGRVSDESVVAGLVEFAGTPVRAVAETVAGGAERRAAECLAAGARAGRRLREGAEAELRHVLLLSDGLAVNGTELVAGFREVLGPGIPVTGGLAGDGARFGSTYVGLGADVRQGQIVAVGFYGGQVVVRHSSRCGWEGFGPRRRVTRAQDNVLLELDGQPALGLYQRYLGERAAGLPATGLLFPLELTRDSGGANPLVRTLLAVDEAAQSLTFAGDLPEGWYVRLMKATAEQIVAGAARAGRDVAGQLAGQGAALAIMVSCVGRRLVLGQRVEQELEAVMGALPPGTAGLGFYSYGEACPCAGSGLSELHNQTMTLTVLGERE